VDHRRVRRRHLERAHHLIAAGAIAVAIALMLALSACGGGGTPSVAQACATAGAALPPVSAVTTKAGARAAGATAASAFRTLNLTLGNMATPATDPQDFVNLRNSAAALAIEFRSLGVLQVQQGSGLIGPVRTTGLAYYAQIERAASGLGIPACSAAALGRPLFIALAARVVAPAGPDLATAGAAACANLTDAYGTDQVAVDALAADAQLERSSAALHAAATDLAAVHTPAGVALRGAIARAAAVLETATAAVNRGAPPGVTSTLAFRRSSALLLAAFRSAGVVCRIPGT
jgi:hypothetical protein